MYAPASYRRASSEAKKEVCNGCGAKGVNGKIVPDTIWGLNITEACNIHDWMYMEGKTQKDKKRADDVFLENVLSIIEEKSHPWLKWIRRYRAMTYYNFVVSWGETAFWNK